jgi:hypothetical protein
MTTISTQSFDSVLADVTSGAIAVRDRIQELSVFALRFYAGDIDGKEPGNTAYLSKIKKALDAKLGLNSKQWMDWLKSVADVGIAKSGDICKTKDGTVYPTALSTKWYEFGKGDKETPKIDIGKAVARAISALESSDVDSLKFDSRIILSDLERLTTLLRRNIGHDVAETRMADATAAAHARKDEDAKKAAAQAKRRATIAAKKVAKIELPAVEELKAA